MLKGKNRPENYASHREEAHLDLDTILSEPSKISFLPHQECIYLKPESSDSEKDLPSPLAYLQSVFQATIPPEWMRELSLLHIQIQQPSAPHGLDHSIQQWVNRFSAQPLVQGEMISRSQWRIYVLLKEHPHMHLSLLLSTLLQQWTSLFQSCTITWEYETTCSLLIDPSSKFLTYCLNIDVSPHTTDEKPCSIGEWSIQSLCKTLKQVLHYAIEHPKYYETIFHIHVHDQHELTLELHSYIVRYFPDLISELISTAEEILTHLPPSPLWTQRDRRETSLRRRQVLFLCAVCLQHFRYQLTHQGDARPLARIFPLNYPRSTNEAPSHRFGCLLLLSLSPEELFSLECFKEVCKECFADVLDEGSEMHDADYCFSFPHPRPSPHTASGGVPRYHYYYTEINLPRRLALEERKRLHLELCDLSRKHIQKQYCVAQHYPCFLHIRRRLIEFCKSFDKDYTLPHVQVMFEGTEDTSIQCLLLVAQQVTQQVTQQTDTQHQENNEGTQLRPSLDGLIEVLKETSSPPLSAQHEEWKDQENIGWWILLSQEACEQCMFSLHGWISQTLKAYLGPYRDCNGRFIEQQKNILPEKTLLREERQFLHLFMRSITPPSAGGKSSVDGVLTLFRKHAPHMNVEEVKGRHAEGEALYGDKMCILFLYSCDASCSYTLYTTSRQWHEQNVSSSYFRWNGVYVFIHVFHTNLRIKQREFCEELRSKANEWMCQKHLGSILRVNDDSQNANFNSYAHCPPEHPEGEFRRLLYEGLTTLSQEGEPILAMAKDVEVSHNKRMYTFHMRPCLWSDNTPVTAYDFVSSWMHLLDHKNNYRLAYAFDVIQNAQRFHQGLCSAHEVGIEAKSDSELVIKLDVPYPHLLALLSHWIFFPRSKKEYADGGERLKGGIDLTQMSANGPFMTDRWVDDRTLQLLPNPYYWKKESISFQKVHLSFHSFRKAKKMFLKGNLDWISLPDAHHSFDHFSILKKSSKKDLSSTSSPSNPPTHISDELTLDKLPRETIYYATLNTQQPPFQEAHQRKLLAQVFNLEQFLEEHRDLFGEETATATSHLPPLLHLHKKRKNHPQKGLSLANIEGIETSAVLECFYNHEDDCAAAMAHLCSQSWSPHIKVQPHPLPKSLFYQRLNQKNFKLAILPQRSIIQDAHLFLAHFKCASFHYTQWVDADFMQILHQAEQTQDLKERYAYLRKAESILWESMPCIPLLSFPQMCTYHSYLKGPLTLPNGEMDLTHASFQWERAF